MSTVKALLRDGILMLSKGEIKPASKKLQKALKLAPNHRNVLFFLGVSYVRQGKHKKAREQFKKAWECGRRDVAVIFHYGLSLWRTGERDRALNYLIRSLQFIEGEDLNDVVKLIHKIKQASKNKGAKATEIDQNQPDILALTAKIDRISSELEEEQVPFFRARVARLLALRRKRFRDQ